MDIAKFKSAEGKIILINTDFIISVRESGQPGQSSIVTTEIQNGANKVYDVVGDINQIFKTIWQIPDPPELIG